MHQSSRFNDKKYYYFFFYRKRNENPYISCTRRYGRMCVYGRCSPGACLLNVPVGFQARKAVLCLLGLHSESKPFQSRSTVEIPRKAVGGKKAEPFQVETGLPNQSGPQPDLDIWWRHPHLQNGAHAEKHEGRSLPGSLLHLEVSFPHTTLRAVSLDNEKSGVSRKNAVRWTFVRSWEVKRPTTRVFQLKEMPDKEQNIEKKKVSVIFWTFGKMFLKST